MNYAIVSITKLKTLSAIKKLNSHNKREYDMPHVDVNRTIFNKYRVPEGSGILDEWKRRIMTVEADKSQKSYNRKDAVKGIEYLMTASDPSQFNLNDWYEENYKWLCERHGEENVLSFDLHMDETTPHIHAIVIPIDKRGKLCAKSFIDGPYQLRRLLDEYSERMSMFGLCRCEKYSKAKKITLKSFYGAINRIDNNPAPEQGDMSDKDYIYELTEYIKTLRFAYTKIKLDKNKAENTIGARIRQAFEKYKFAIRLQNVMTDLYDGNEDDVNERLKQYIEIEENVKKDDMDKIIAMMKEHYENRHNDAEDVDLR